MQRHISFYNTKYIVIALYYFILFLNAEGLSVQDPCKRNKQKKTTERINKMTLSIHKVLNL